MKILEINKISRRNLLKGFFGFIAGLILPIKSIASAKDQPAFESKTVSEALKSINADKLTESTQILIKAPDITENGAQVLIEVTSQIPGTQIIYVILDHNPFPLVASFSFFEGVEPYFRAPFKVQETSHIQAIVKTNEKFYIARKKVEVTIGGCGV
jgi:sulfur-oxidizing protein SoxY